MATNSYSNLQKGSATWNPALRNFGIVTVMNATVYDILDGKTMKEFKDLVKSDVDLSATGQTTLEALYKMDPTFATRSGEDPNFTYALNEDAVIDFTKLKVNEIITLYLMTNEVCRLKYLKTANATQEGPTKTITGGQNASPLIKYGKTARLEMQDALGNAEALEALAGMTVEYFRTTVSTDYSKGSTDVLHATTTFAGHKTIIGETFIVDANTGKQIPALIVFYDFLSDSLLSLTQDAEGDATVFDMNGDLNEVRILIGDDDHTTSKTDGVVTGTFYTILPKLDYVKTENNKLVPNADDIVDEGITNQ